MPNGTYGDVGGGAGDDSSYPIRGHGVVPCPSAADAAVAGR